MKKPYLRSCARCFLVQRIELFRTGNIAALADDILERDKERGAPRTQ
jgi:hypothetical protein